MEKFVRLGFRALTIFVIAVFVLALLAYWILGRSKPDYNESYTTDYQGYDVEIIRDRNAIPHIYADDQRQAFFGQGIAHAQDRLWQMAMIRRTAQGRISEIAGAETVELDLFLRALNLWERAQYDLKQLDSKTQDLLQAYADGVNSYVFHINETKRGAGGPEFLLVDREFAPWTPVDSLAVLKILALQLSSAAESEILRAQISQVLTQEQIEQFYSDEIISEIQLTKTSPSGNREITPLLRSYSPTGYGREAGASNAFAVAPERSVSGKALLASDPHLPLNAPSIWHITHQEYNDTAIIGGTIPGFPTPAIGRSNNLSWALTTSNLDDQDLVVLKLDPNDTSAYLTPNGSEKLKSRKTYIKVKGEIEPRSFTLFESKFGPVIPAVGPWDIQSILPENHLIALSWTAFAKNDQSAKAAFDLSESQTVEDAIKSLELHGSPAQMFTLADSSGSIAQIAAGKMPRRSENNISKGILPAPSWLSPAGFEGFFDFSENPRVLNPSENVLIHTNNKFIDRPYPRHFSNHWGDNYRIRRAEELMKGSNIHSTESLIEAQNDVISLDARILLALIAQDLWYNPREQGLRKEVIDLLADWNGEFRALGAEALIYSVWIAELNQIIFEDELGPLFHKTNPLKPYRLEKAFRNIDGAEQWCDIKQTTETETCKQMASIALDKALERLSIKYGDNIESWRWGNAHRAFHENMTLGNVPLLGSFAHITQELNGGNQTLMRAATSKKDPFDFTAIHGGALRMIVNFAEPNSTRIIISTGQSGHLLSKFYDDQSTLWAAGEYINLSTDTQIIEGNKIGSMRVSSASAPSETER